MKHIMTEYGEDSVDIVGKAMNRKLIDLSYYSDDMVAKTLNDWGYLANRYGRVDGKDLADLITGWSDEARGGFNLAIKAKELGDVGIDDLKNILKNYGDEVAEATFKGVDNNLVDFNEIGVYDLADYYTTNPNAIPETIPGPSGKDIENNFKINRIFRDDEGNVVVIPRGVGDSEFGTYTRPLEPGQTTPSNYQPTGYQHMIDKHKNGLNKPNQVALSDGTTIVPKDMTESEYMDAVEYVTRNPTSVNGAKYEGTYTRANGDQIDFIVWKRKNPDFNNRLVIESGYPVSGKGVRKWESNQWWEWTPTGWVTTTI